jgi:hypothetical protein
LFVRVASVESLSNRPVPPTAATAAITATIQTTIVRHG